MTYNGYYLQHNTVTSFVINYVRCLAMIYLKYIVYYGKYTALYLMSRHVPLTQNQF